jgi:SAM-dependent methyltransferase
VAPLSAEARLRELRPYAESGAHMEGWSFDYRPVPLGAPPPWDYVARARELAAGAQVMLDMGTGGGEVFSEILPHFQGLSLATEAWGPNVAVAARNLRPYGAHVVHGFNLNLPFAAGSVDLILNRHEELDPADVARVLAPGGRVLTQQVHPDYHAELREFFPRQTVYEHHDPTYPAGFEAAGLKIVTAQQHEQRVAYRELGHLVYEIAATPWALWAFDVEADLDALLAVEARYGGADGVVLLDRRYVLEAYKPR